MAGGFVLFSRLQNFSLLFNDDVLNSTGLHLCSFIIFLFVANINVPISLVLFILAQFKLNKHRQYMQSMLV